MYEIRKASYMDYIFLFGDHRTAYSDLSAETANASGGDILMAWNDSRAAGLMCVSRESGVSNILYAYTAEEMRGKGIFSALLEYEIQHSPYPLKISISESREAYGIVSHVCRRYGFELQSSCIIYSGRSEDFVRWEEYMAGTGGKLCAMLERHGFSCVSFAEADSRLLDEIYDSGSSDFGNKLDVRVFFDNEAKKMNRNMSFAAVKDGELAAYTLVRSPDSVSAVFEHISVSHKHIGSGCILLPFAKAMESFKKYGCTRAAYAMYEDNNK
jgi:GNAT superfamily N-acetyltransferase